MTDSLFAVDPDARTIRGLLLPFGELSSPSISGEAPVMFSAATDLALPADPMVATLYDNDHDRFEPRGRGVSFEKTDAGIVATFAVARTPEGDALLKRAADPTKPKLRLSAEIKGLVRRAQDAIRGAVTGGSIVGQGAFGSAALFSAVDGVVEELEGEPIDIKAEVREALQELLPEFTGEIQTPSPAPAADETDPDGTEPEDKKKENMMAAATMPGTLQAPGSQKKELTRDGLFAAIANRDGDVLSAANTPAGSKAMFAIATIQDSGPSTVTIGADVRTPSYLGELWKRQPYRRRYVPLLSSKPLTAPKVYGWQWDDGKEPVVGDYAGNTAEVPSNAVDTKQLTADAARIAGGHKLDRRFLDFNDQEVISSYFDRMTESVARQTDAKALAAIIAAATATTPGTVPSGVAKGLSAIVDGALDVLDSENQPSFALVDKALWRELVLITKDDVLAFLSMSLGLDEGDLGGFTIRPATIGTSGNAGKQVIVGAKEAITWFELGGEAPIRVEGIDPHHGAIDPAVFAYWATLTNNAAAIRVVTTA